MGEERAYCNLGNAYCNLGDFKTAFDYHERDMQIAKEMGDRPKRVEGIVILATLISISK